MQISYLERKAQRPNNLDQTKDVIGLACNVHLPWISYNKTYDSLANLVELL